MSDRQEWLDKFYFAHGPCCAGCDWWRSFDSLVGECLKSAPVSADKRWAMLGIDISLLRLSGGHVVTSHDHHCRDFKDEFDWRSLPLPYRKRIGAPLTAPPVERD